MEEKSLSILVKSSEREKHRIQCNIERIFIIRNGEVIITFFSCCQVNKRKQICSDLTIARN